MAACAGRGSCRRSGARRFSASRTWEAPTPPPILRWTTTADNTVWEGLAARDGVLVVAGYLDDPITGVNPRVARVQASTGEVLPAFSVGSGPTSDDYANAVVIDGDEVWASGQAYGQMRVWSWALTDGAMHAAWGSTYGIEAVGIAARNGVAIATGTVADLSATTGMGGFQLLAPNGTPGWNVTGGTAGIQDEAGDVVIDGGGNVYLVGATGTDTVSPFVLVASYTPTGTWRWDRNPGEGVGIHAALLPNGNLAVLGDRNSEAWVTVLTPDGDQLWHDSVGLSGMVIPGLFPRAIATDGDNNVYVLGYTGPPSTPRLSLRRYAFADQSETWKFEEDDVYPNAVAVDWSTGEIYLAAGVGSNKAVGRISKYARVP